MNAIVVTDKQWAIGRSGDLLFSLPGDMKHFRALTTGGTVIMGRKTWESLPFKPLPGRTNHVLSSREPGAWSEGAVVSTDLPDLATDAWIMGGGQIYEATLDQVGVVALTLIDVHVAPSLPNPVFAPHLGPEFTLVRDGEWETSRTGTRYKHQRYERTRK